MSPLHYALIVFLPLIGSLIVGAFFDKISDKQSQVITASCVGLAAILAMIGFSNIALGGETTSVFLLDWIVSGDMSAPWKLRFDTLSIVMLCVVTIVSTMVHIYSIGYMSEDPSIPRFMAYLSLFTFFMNMLVTSDNLIQLFFGWEGVGLASYLLIGFWNQKDSANKAAMKAFVVNRVGDFGFALGIFAIYILFGSVNFNTIFANVSAFTSTNFHILGYEMHALTLTCLLLFIGAMGKSAQLGLHTWLPDAMEGPTPVSALIHAATMVTAGVFMLVRLSPLFEFAPDALAVVTVVGACTAFFAATIGLTQYDIKRVIAYSTCSQLGYMFFAIGVSAYSAAIFHLMTHAFFKALLFLGAGSVIHGVHHEQDMRNMGGLYKLMPKTYAMMWIGSLALAGIPLFAGYYSKDMILEAAWASHGYGAHFAYYMGIAAALMTAFYSWRLIFMTFHGETRMSKKDYGHVHESPTVMLIPLYVLSIGALFAGYLGFELFVGHDRADFWQSAIFVLPEHDSVEHAHHVPLWVKKLPLLMGVLGIFFAYLAYMKFTSIPGKVTKALPGLHNFLYKKWYFDELYDAIFVKPAKAAGRWLWQAVDLGVIDRFGPNGLAALTNRISRYTSSLQTGYIYHYAFGMVFGVVVLTTVYIFAVRGM